MGIVTTQYAYYYNFRAKNVVCNEIYKNEFSDQT